MAGVIMPSASSRAVPKTARAAKTAARENWGAGPGGGPQVNVYDGRNFHLLYSFYGMPGFFTGGVYVAAGDVNGDGHADVIVGADKGAGPQVNVYSGTTGSLLESFYAFPTSFTGGVRVAAGELERAGFADIIVAAGPGGLPQVSVFRGTDLSLLQSFYAFPSSFTGGLYVASVAGEVVVSAGSQVSVFRDGAPVLSFFDPRFAPAPEVLGLGAGSVRVGAVDVNGRTEILTAPGAGSPALVDVFDGSTAALLDEFFAFAPNFLGGAFVGG